MRTLIIALPGMGNTILAIPLIRELKKNYKNSQIDLLVGLKSSELILENCPYINKIHLIDTKINKNIFKTLKTLYILRKKKYDYSFTTFPAKQDQYNILAKIINAKNRVTHKYKSKLIFLQNKLIPIKQIHDIHQNLNLLHVLKIGKASSKLELWLNQEKNISKKEDFTIGIHPGSSIERGMIDKRWPPEYFSELIDLLLKDLKNVKFKLFLGPAEQDLSKIKDLSKNKKTIQIINKNLKETSNEIKNCNLFISNDSGLMHIAAASGVPTVGIFLSTDERRTHPFCTKKLILKNGVPHSFYRQNIENLKGENIPIEEEKIQIINPSEASKRIKQFIQNIK